MRHGAEGPEEDGEGVAGLGAEAIDKAAGEEEAEAVADLKGDENVAEVVVEAGLVGRWGGVVPAHEREVVQHGLDEREHRAVHVVDRGGEEEEGTHEPGQPSALWWVL